MLLDMGQGGAPILLTRLLLGRVHHRMGRLQAVGSLDLGVHGLLVEGRGRFEQIHGHGAGRIVTVVPAGGSVPGWRATGARPRAPISRATPPPGRCGASP